MEQKEVVPLDFKQVAHLLVVHKQAEPFITEALKRFVRHKEMADILIQYAHAAGEVIEETKEGTRCPHCHYRYSRGELFKTEEDCYICCECGLKFKIEQEIIEICHTTTKKVYDEDIKNNSKNPSIIDSCRNAGKIILKKVKKVLVGGVAFRLNLNPKLIKWLYCTQYTITSSKAGFFVPKIHEKL